MKSNALWLCFPALVCLGEAAAQDYPSKTIRIIVSAAGSSGDVSARLLSARIAGPLRQQVIVENMPDAISVTTAAKAPADGYTMLLDATSLWVGPLLRDLPYNVFRDFAPISTTDRSPSTLGVHPSVPATSVKELIALAKARPGTINYGSASAGSLSHLATELFKSTAGIDIVRIPYKGGGAAVAAVLSGQVQMIFNSAGSISQHFKSGKLRPLGVASLQPSPLVPGVPPIAETLPGFEATLKQGLFAPAKTPPAVVRRLNQEIVAALNSAELKEKYLAIGFEAASSSPEEFTALIKSEVAKWDKLIKTAGIKAD